MDRFQSIWIDSETLIFRRFEPGSLSTFFRNSDLENQSLGPEKPDWGPEMEYDPRQMEYGPRQMEYDPRQMEYDPRQMEYDPRQMEYDPTSVCKTDLESSNPSRV